MDGSATAGPLRFFLDLPDPRARNVRHRLIDILIISICAVICDADGWEDFEDFARAKGIVVQDLSGSQARGALGRHLPAGLCTSGPRGL